MNKLYDVCHNNRARWPGSVIEPTSSGGSLEQASNSRLQDVDEAYRKEKKSVNITSKHAPNKGAQGVDNMSL